MPMNTNTIPSLSITRDCPAASPAKEHPDDAGGDDDYDREETQHHVNRTNDSPMSPSSLANQKNVQERPEAALVSLRVGVSLAIALLFTFVPSSGQFSWPESYWVYVTAGIVAWLPDTGNVAKKTVQRIVGTVLGCVLGLALGAVSVRMGEDETTVGSPQQGLFLGLTVTAFGFLYPFLIFKLGYFNTYGSALAVVTFGLVVLVWYDPEIENPWETGLWRVVNIILGSLIATACSLLVFPLSTKQLVQSKVDALVKQTGGAAKAVFDAAADVTEGTGEPPPSLWDLVQENEDEDEAHQLYIESVNETRAIKTLFPTLRYDLTFRRLEKDQQTAFLEYMRLLLGKLFRTQIAVIVLDTLIRASLHQGDKSNDPIDMLRLAGKHIAQIHDRSLARQVHEHALHELIHVCLSQIRQHLARLGKSDDDDENNAINGNELIDVLMAQTTHRLSHLKSPGQSVLFWRLVEYIILRSIRNHGFFIEYEAAIADSSSQTPLTRPFLATTDERSE